MISSTIASALAPSTSSQRQDACSSSTSVTDAASDSASFSSAMANATTTPPTNDASNREGGDVPKQTPGDGGKDETTANAQSANESRSGQRAANTNAASRSSATNRGALATEASAASAPATNAAKAPAAAVRTDDSDGGTGANSQRSAKSEADKPTSDSETRRASTVTTTDTAAPVGVSSPVPTDASVGALVQAAAAQAKGEDLSAPNVGDRAALLPGNIASTAGFRASDGVDAESEAQVVTAQGQAQALQSPGQVSNSDASVAGAVPSFAMLFARSERPQGLSASDNPKGSLGDCALANGGTLQAVSSPTAALASLAGTPIHAGATLGLGPAEINIATRIGDPGFGQDVSRQLVFLAKTGVQSAQLSLQPAELGPVSVSIQMNGLQASLVISASHAATRAALQEALPHLSELFQSSGLQLADAQVGDGSARNADQGASQGYGLAINDPLNSTVAARAAVIGVDATAGGRAAASGLIDTFA